MTRSAGSGSDGIPLARDGLRTGIVSLRRPNLPTDSQARESNPRNTSVRAGIADQAVIVSWNAGEHILAADEHAPNRRMPSSQTTRRGMQLGDAEAPTQALPLPWAPRCEAMRIRVCRVRVRFGDRTQRVEAYALEAPSPSSLTLPKSAGA